MHRRFLGPKKVAPIWRSKTPQIRHILPGLHWQWSQAHHRKQAPAAFDFIHRWYAKMYEQKLELPNFAWWFDFRDSSQVWPLVYGMNQFFIDIGRGVDVPSLEWCRGLPVLISLPWLIVFFWAGWMKYKYYSVIYIYTGIVKSYGEDPYQPMRISWFMSQGF